jgi:hypothetical protein
MAQKIRSVPKNSKKDLYITELLFAYVAPVTLAGPRYISLQAWMESFDILVLSDT